MTSTKTPLAGRIILVTGATTGIGLVTARTLAERGATVVVVGRDTGRADRAVRSIKDQAPKSDIHLLLADLSSQEQVRRLAQEYQARFPRLDTLINNAGAVFARRQVSVDGIEMTLALNHLAPFLLTNLLLPSLKASQQARVIAVASMAHLGARVPFDNLNHERGRYRSFEVYGQSKLMNLMFTYELARRLEGTGVTANALHPGFVASNFGRNNGGWWNVMFTLAKPFAISPERGARTSIYLASSPDVATATGEYFINRSVAKSSAASYDREAQQRLWDVSEELTGLRAGAPA